MLGMWGPWNCWVPVLSPQQWKALTPHRAPLLPATACPHCWERAGILGGRNGEPPDGRFRSSDRQAEAQN